jgi:hypothetical protein
MKADVLAAIVRQAGVEKTAAAAVFDAAMKLSEEAIFRDDFELAGRYAKAAQSAARKSHDVEQNRTILARMKEIEQFKGRFEAVQKALDTLASDSSDGGANFVAGQWYCFTKSNWDKGLPLLAKGNHEDLARAAKLELAAPTGAKQQIAVADAWWSLADKETTGIKQALEARARHWYEEAVVKTSGLEKARIQKRLHDESSAAVAAAGHELKVDVVSLPFVGKTVVAGQPQDIVVDGLDLPKGFKLPPPSIPGAQVKHFVFLHAVSEFDISLEAKLRKGAVAKRFNAYFYLTPDSRASGSDGMVWTVEAGSRSHLKLLLTTPQSQDTNPVDLALPPGTSRIVIRALPGTANNCTHDWGIMANPVVVFRK